MDDLDIISIIIPVYNSSKYIQQSLLSVLYQSCKMYELIIVDDGSTDNSIQLIQEFLSKNPEIQAKVLVNSENKGVSKARNRGLILASGTYICFLDADDSYKPDFVSLMKSQIVKGFDFVYCGYDIIDEDNHTTVEFASRRKYLDNSEEIIKQYIYSKTHFSIVAAIYKKKFLMDHKILYNENCRLGEDIEFLCNLLLKGPKCTSVKQSLYQYIRRPESTTNNITSNHVNDCISALSRIQQNIPTLKGKFLFEITRKANMSFHLMEELYQQKVDGLRLLNKRFYFSLLTLLHMLKCPMHRFRRFLNFLLFFYSS